MKTILLILGNDDHPDSDGRYNRTLHDCATTTLSRTNTILTTSVTDPWDLDAETAKFRSADAVIFQFPVFWYMPPARLKAYLDQVYQRDIFFGKVKPDGTAGLMQGRYMLSTTWNAPQTHFNNPDTFFNGLTIDDTLISMRKTQEFIGLTPLPHFSCHQVISAPDITRDTARYIKHLNKIFADT